MFHLTNKLSILITVASVASFTVSVPAFAATYVKVDGSSTVYPITEAVAEEFQKANRDVRVTVGISGTGGGFKKFCRGETDISNASRPIKPSEFELCAQNGIDYIELPVAYDGLAVLVNPQNTWVEYMTPAELKRIWEPDAQETITRWNQIRPEWPNEEIALYGPGTDSGTYDYFTDAIVGKEGASRGDFTSSEDDNVLVYGIAGDKNALGFFGLAYYAENKDKLKLVPINAGNGPVFPSEETVNNGTYQPLSRPIFIYVSKQSAQKPHIKSFVEYYINNTAELSREVGYVHLPAKVLTLAAARFMKGTTGSVFGGGGSKVGVSIADLMAKE